MTYTLIALTAASEKAAQENIMTVRLTITAVGEVGFQDYYGLQGIMSGKVPAGSTRIFNMTNEQWNTVRPVIVQLSQQRLELIESGVRTGRYQPLMSYDVLRLPGGRPRVHQLEGTVTLSGATQSLVIRGENLIQGFQASYTHKKNTDGQIVFTATRKGPIGNRVSIKVDAVPTSTNAGSVTVTRRAHGGALITVVPPDAGTDATGHRASAIAAQLNASTEAARFVTAVGAGSGAVGVVAETKLSGGDGTGMALLDVQTAVSGSYLRIEARAPGNQGNLINVTFATPAGGGSIVVTGNSIVVTPAAAGPSIGAIATQINAHAAAKVLVKATAVGVGGTSLGAPVGQNYLYGGSGDTVVARVGGALCRITDYTDTAVTIAFEGSGDPLDVLTGAGVAAGEQALVTLLSDYGVIQAGQAEVAA